MSEINVDQARHDALVAIEQLAEQCRREKERGQFDFSRAEKLKEERDAAIKRAEEAGARDEAVPTCCSNECGELATHVEEDGSAYHCRRHAHDGDILIGEALGRWRTAEQKARDSWAAYVGCDGMLKASQERERIIQDHRERACEREREARAETEKLADAWQACEAEKAARIEAERQLALVRAPAESVWFWQGDGCDHLGSLVCPVVMSAETLRGLVQRTAEYRRALGFDIDVIEHDVGDAELIAAAQVMSRLRAENEKIRALVTRISPDALRALENGAPLPESGWFEDRCGAAERGWGNEAGAEAIGAVIEMLSEMPLVTDAPSKSSVGEVPIAGQRSQDAVSAAPQGGKELGHSMRSRPLHPGPPRTPPVFDPAPPPPAEPAAEAIDEWTDEECDRGLGPWLNSRWQDALAAIKRRNAKIRELTAALEKARKPAERGADVDCKPDWHQVGDGAFARPFGTIRVCIDCGCLVAGGPTRCVRCAREVPS